MHNLGPPTPYPVLLFRRYYIFAEKNLSQAKFLARSPVMFETHVQFLSPCERMFISKDTFLNLGKVLNDVMANSLLFKNFLNGHFSF